MKIKLLWIGKTNEQFLKDGIKIYVNRLKHYVNFEIVEILDVKNSSKFKPNLLKQAEAKNLLNQIQPEDFVVLLDEKGKEFKSMQFSKQLEHWQLNSIKTLTFVVAGAFGADEKLKSRAQLKLSLSKMTFSHQMIRLFFTEQLYRAFTILNNQKYHNE